MRSVHLVAIELCRFLEEEQVEYALLGDACAPSARSHTIELVVPGPLMRRLPLLLHRFCERSDIRLVSCVRQQRRVWRCHLSWINREEHPEFVRLEVFSDLVHKGRFLLAGSELLQGRHVDPAPLRLRSTFFVATPAMELIYYLLRCVHAGTLGDEQGRHLRECWQRDPAAASAQVARFWDPTREGGLIMRAIESAQWESIRDAMPMLQRALRRRRLVNPADALYALWRRIRDWFRPRGVLLACLGPEGVGKSRVIEALCARPPAPFESVHAMELRPKVVRAGSKGPASKSRAPRGRLAAIAKLGMFALDYWIGYVLRIRPRLVRGLLVVSNRYYDDVLVDPRRYRMARPLAFARALLPWIPRPDLWLVFDAPSEVISSRNSAISAEECFRQRSEYRRLLRGYENVVVLDARQPLERLIAQAERVIAAHLATRTAERLQLPLPVRKNPLSTRVLLFFCRRNVPLLSRLVRILYNSDIYSRLPADIYMPHPYGIVIHAQAAIGDRVTIMQQVTIGDKDPAERVAPVIGNDVYIGAGARVLGDVRIGDGVTIGANAVVTQDIPPGVTVVGANRIVDAPASAASVRSVTPFPVGMQKGA